MDKKVREPSTPLERAVESNVPAFLEAAPDAMVIVGQDGRILLVNGVIVLSVQIGALRLKPSIHAGLRPTPYIGPPICRCPMPCPRSPFASSARRPCRLA
jgi:hypothetical protein